MKVGFIGLGTMGGPMALNARKGGHELIVNDLRRDAAKPHLEGGARWARTPAKSPRRRRSSSPRCPVRAKSKRCRRACSKTMRRTRRGSTCRRIRRRSFASCTRDSPAKGIAMLDSPVSGGPCGAKSGKLAIWSAATARYSIKFRPVLDAIGDQVIYIGPIGAGSVAKLVHNCAGYAIQTALAEVFTMGVKAGVDPLALWAAVRQCSLGRQRTFDRLGKQFLQG